MRVLVCDPISPAAVETMRRKGLEVDVRDTITPEELIQTIPPYQAIVVRSRTKVRRPLLEAAANLQVIVRGGVGVDNIDSEFAHSRQVRVLNTPAASTASVAELTIAFIFALARPIVQATESLRAGQWEKTRFHGSEVQGKVLGIIGMGRIGNAVAARAAALGMLVLGYDRHTVGPQPYVIMVQLDELLGRSDYISLHVPHTDATHHLIGRDTIARMKDGVRIVNCARGGVVDEDALYEALVSGKVASAALDVFETEPATGNRLLTLPQVIGSPHIGAGTVEATDRIGGEVAEVLIRFAQENS